MTSNLCMSQFSGVYAFIDEGPEIVVQMLDEKFSITGGSPEAAKYASSIMFSIQTQLLTC